MTPQQAHTRVHGGPGADGPATHDFSTNANAVGPCPYALEAVRGADAARYPDPAYTALRRWLADFHGVAPGRVVLAASASEFIMRMTAAVRCLRPQAQAWWPAHSYGDYAQAAHAWGLPRAQAPGAASLAWLCRPSSPRGQDEPAPAGWGAGPGVHVLDCAYEPLRLEAGAGLYDGLGEGFATDAAEAGCWQLWTPNKALGLTGVRAAYAIAPRAAMEGGQALLQGLEALAPSWPIGAHGLALLQAWCDSAVQRWLAESRAVLQGWKQRQLQVCRDLGWPCLPSVANFFCAAPAGAGAGNEATGTVVAAQAERLRAHGVQVRDCTSFGLHQLWRLAVLPPASQDALAAAWLHVRKGAAR